MGPSPPSGREAGVEVASSLGSSASPLGAYTYYIADVDQSISNMMLSLFITPSLSIAMSSQEEEEQDPIFDDDSDAASVVSTGSVTGITATAPAEDHCADLQPEVEESQLEEEEEGTPEATGQEEAEEAIEDDDDDRPQPVPLTKPVRIRWDEVDTTLMSKLRISINALKSKVNRDIDERLHRQYDLSHMSMEIQHFHAFTSDRLWHHLLKIVNSNLPRDTMTHRELELLVRLLAAHAYYGQPPDTIYGDRTDPRLLSDFPLIEEIIQKFGEGGRDARLRAKKLIYALDPIEQQTNSGYLWKQPFTENDRMTELERIMTEQHRKVLPMLGQTDILADDDKLRHRSFLSSLAYAYSRSKSAKSFGPVLNIMALVPMGHHWSSTVTARGENCCSTTRRMSMRGTNKEDDKQVDFRNCIFSGDRGYNDPEQTDFVTSRNGHIFNTVKRGPSLCFKWGNCNYRTQHDQKPISEHGPSTVFGAEKKSNNKTIHQVLFRMGTGRNVMTQSTEPINAYNNWNFVPKHHTDMNAFLSKDFMKEQKIERTITIDNHNADSDEDMPPLNNNLRQLTESQRDPMWFLLRAFKISSTAAYRTVQRMGRNQLTNSELELLEECVGLKLPQYQEAQDDPREAHADFLELSAEEKLKATKKDLKKVCQDFNIVGCTLLYKAGKEAMINKIMEVQETYEPPTASTEFEAYIASSFLKPINKSDSKVAKAMEEGTHVVKAIKSFVEEKSGGNLLLEDDPAEVGLVERSDKCYLVTSPDGICHKAKINIGGVESTMDVFVEIKSPSASDTKEDANKRTSSVDRIGSGFVHCTFGDETFKKIVAHTGYRMQNLHHSTVLQLQWGLFVISYHGTIRSCTLVNFPRQQRLVYENMLTKYATTHLNPLFGNDDEEWPDLQIENLSQGKYKVEPETAKFLFGLQKTARQEAINYNSPLPATKQFLPRSIAYWNATKGMVDVISRYLRHLHVEYHNVSPGFSIQLRMLQICGISGCFTTRMLHALSAKWLDSETSYRQLKHRMANWKPVREYFRIIASSFRLNYLSKGMEVENDRSTQYSPMVVRTEGGRAAAAAGVASMEAPSQNDLANVKTLVQNLRNASACQLFEKNEMCRLVRLCTFITHHGQHVGSANRRCQLCAMQTGIECESCGVRLCNKVRKGSHTCIFLWHNPASNLVNLRKEMSVRVGEEKKRKRIEEGGQQQEEGQQHADGNRFRTPANRTRRPRSSSRSTGDNSEGMATRSSCGRRTRHRTSTT